MLKMYSTEIQKLDKSSKELIKKWNKKYFHEITIDIQRQTSVLESIRNNFKVFEDSRKKHFDTISDDILTKESYQLHINNQILLKTLYTQLLTKNEVRDFISGIESGLNADLQNLQAKIIDDYNPGTEYTEQGIGSNRLLRKTGNFFYHLRCIPRKTRNWFARLFKREEKPLKSRRHSIHYRFLTQGFLLNKYVAFLQSSTFEVQKKIVLSAHSLFNHETNLINSNYQLEDGVYTLDKLPDLNEQLKEIEKFYTKNKKTFLTQLEKSGTWEFPLFYIHLKGKQKIKHTYKLIDSTYRLWNSTFYAFYEDWRFREELFSFISALKILASQTIKAYSDKLEKTLSPVIAKKREYIEGLVNRIPQPDDSDPLALKHFFNSELYKLHKISKNQTIVEDLHKTSFEVEKILKKLEVEVAGNLEKLSDKSGVVRSPNYEKGIHKSEIYFFSPVEFIDFECIPPFLHTVNSISTDFQNNFKEIILEFSDIDQIIDFTLDTAISLINAHSDQEQTVLMFREGLTRSLNILDRISGLKNETLNTKGEDLAQAFTNLFENIKKLDSNTSILSIYSKLLKSKAIQESKDKRRRIKGFILSSGSYLATGFKRPTEISFNFYREIRKKLKLDKAPVFVSSEISNYLANINRRVYKLPVIYRYLFENTPVKEINLFLSRQLEIDKLNHALKDWKAGNFAATLVIGENGSGKSSLFQNYLSTIKGSYKVKYLSVNRFYSSENDFYELMQDIFENKELDSDQKILELVNTATKQQIIVIDGLERVFIRKPGGFDCLHKLMSFMVSTNDQAFWICAVSLYSCNYLNKTISLKENFDYLIELNHLSSENVKGIVLKRHRLSGYFIKYKDELKEPPQKKNGINYQLQLENDFFNELHRFAEGNISLSLYYWLESISEFTDKDLYIKQFLPPDFSFLETLSAEKIYTLLLIVLHGKITTDSHAIICNQSIEKSRRVLTILKEDSIVILKGNYYILNGILYRHVIELLKNKNLIH